jgi:hypothetical protein
MDPRLCPEAPVPHPNFLRAFQRGLERRPARDWAQHVPRVAGAHAPEVPPFPPGIRRLRKKPVTNLFAERTTDLPPFLFGWESFADFPGDRQN